MRYTDNRRMDGFSAIASSTTRVDKKCRKKQVLRYAFLSRFIVWFLSTFSVLVIPCYDTSSTITIISTTDATAIKPESIIDVASWSIFGQYSRWDAAYFLRISQVGYEYEKNHAFQPFLPILINVFRYCSGLSYFSNGDHSIMSIETSYLIAGVFVTNIAFVLAAVALYDLSMTVLKNERLAYTSSLLFCFNPASIFMSAIYTGSLYACLSFYGMLYFERTSMNNCNNIDSSNKYSRVRHLLESLFAIIMFACACATRSNGLLLGAYPIYFIFKDIVWPIILTHLFRLRVEDMPGKNMNYFCCRGSMQIMYLLKYITTSICAIAPYFLIQHYGYKLYCSNNNNNKSKPHWCEHSNIYKHVQEKYWGSGVLFGYWTANQIPNFVLAFPVLYISYASFYMYLRETKHQSKYLLVKTKKAGDDVDENNVNIVDQVTSSLGLNHIINIRRNLDLPFVGYLSHRVAPYVWHLFGLTTLITILAHVQISTRLMFASCPSIYWFLAYHFNKKKVSTELLPKVGHRIFAKYYLAYSWIYFTLGCVLFSTFYPWT
jgi:GPI mannosyltransferase 2